MAVSEYEFRIGRSHLKGSGWRGLAALGFVLVFRAAMVLGLAFAARPGVDWLFELGTRILF